MIPEPRPDPLERFKMNMVASPSRLAGQVKMPASKSHTIRALLLAALADGESRISNPLDSADTRACVGAVRALGAPVETGPEWRVGGVEGKIRPTGETIDVANSGTTLYLALGAASLGREWVEFTGDDQIRKRSAGPLLNALREMGAAVESYENSGCAPIRVRGPLRGGQVSVRCPTSQYLSSLLLASPLAERETLIHVLELNERPYVDMTLGWLNKLGIQYSHEDMERFHITGGQRYDAFREKICGDFSSATFFLCAAAITNSSLALDDLDMNNAQGDKAVVPMLRRMGARIDIKAHRIHVRGAELKGAEFDLNATPDALPAMAVTGCFAEGETRLVNVPQARIKETDRIRVMCEVLRALGGDAEELPDGLIVRGRGLRGGNASGYGDHRVVMALAVAGLAAEHPVTVSTAEAVNVTFPDFVGLMQEAGGDVRVEP